MKNLFGTCCIFLIQTLLCKVRENNPTMGKKSKEPLGFNVIFDVNYTTFNDAAVQYLLSLQGGRAPKPLHRV